MDYFNCTTLNSWLSNIVSTERYLLHMQALPTCFHTRISLIKIILHFSTILFMLFRIFINITVIPYNLILNPFSSVNHQEKISDDVTTTWQNYVFEPKLSQLIRRRVMSKYKLFLNNLCLPCPCKYIVLVSWPSLFVTMHL